MPDTSDMSHPITRGELREELAALEQKLDQKLENYPTKADLEKKLENYPTKADLAVHLEGWATRILEVARAELAVLREQINADMARHVRAANEEMRDWMRAQDDRYRDLPPRVARLEAKVFAPKRRRSR